MILARKISHKSKGRCRVPEHVDVGVDVDVDVDVDVESETLARLTNEGECFIGVSRHRETEESTRPKVKCIHCFEAFGYGRSVGIFCRLQATGPGGGETPI